MILIKESLYEIKKSKFYAFNYSVDSIEEINTILDSLKKEHKKARHIVYAYKIDGIEKKFNKLVNVIKRRDFPGSPVAKSP